MAGRFIRFYSITAQGAGGKEPPPGDEAFLGARAARHRRLHDRLSKSVSWVSLSNESPSSNPFVLRTQERRLPSFRARTVREAATHRKTHRDRIRWRLLARASPHDRRRLRWKQGGAATTNRATLAVLDFPKGSIVLTEAGSKRRASIRIVEGEEAL